MIWGDQPYRYYRPEQPEQFWYTGRTYAIPQPVKGETWWVKLPGAVALTEVVVTSVTAHTVEVETQPYKTVNRYIRDELQFIEKVYK